MSSRVMVSKVTIKAMAKVMANKAVDNATMNHAVMVSKAVVIGMGNHAAMVNKVVAIATGNLAAMVADKDDLVRGARGTGSTVVMSANKAIEAFRAKPSTGSDVLKSVSSKSGGN